MSKEVEYHLLKLLLLDRQSDIGRLQDKTSGWWFRMDDLQNLFVCCLNNPEKDTISPGDEIVILAPVDRHKRIYLEYSGERLPLSVFWHKMKNVPEWVNGYIVP